jgi:hypothetical protein
MWADMEASKVEASDIYVNCRREWMIDQDDDGAAVEGPEDEAAV